MDIVVVVVSDESDDDPAVVDVSGASRQNTGRLQQVARVWATTSGRTNFGITDTLHSYKK